MSLIVRLVLSSEGQSRAMVPVVGTVIAEAEPVEVVFDEEEVVVEEGLEVEALRAVAVTVIVVVPLPALFELEYC